MAIGKLNKRVTFKINIPEALGAGYADSYFDLITVWCSLKKSTGNKGVSFGEVNVTSSYTLLIRYQSYIESNLRGDVKAVIDGKSYSIEDWELIEEKDFYYKIKVNAHTD